MNATVSQPEIRDQLLLRLAESRSVTDELFRIVRADALYERPIPERHRIVFYIGHLEAFDWNLIAGHALGLGVADKELDRLFAFGIDPVDGGLRKTNLPTGLGFLRSALIISASARDSMRFSTKPFAGFGKQLAISRRKDFERRDRTSVDARRDAGVYAAPTNSGSEDCAARLSRLSASHRPRPPIAARMIDIPAGFATLGIPRGGDVFGWDNEFEEHSVASAGLRD